MTVLVVDDEPVVRDFLLRSIGSAGYNVLEAASSDEAMELAQSFHEPIDLLIIDHLLEDRKRGVDVAAEIAAVKPDIRVLLISGNAQEDVLSEVRTDLMVDFLQKPFTHQVLNEKVRRMLDRRNTAAP